MAKQAINQAPVRLGARLRAARRDRGLTMNELAERTGLTKGFLSQVERDLASTSVASLVSICEALQISVGSLFDKPPTNFVPRDQRRPISFGGEGVDEHLLSPSAETRFQVLEQVIEPGGGSGPEPYALQHGDAEFVHLLDGRLEVTVGTEIIQLSPGDSLTFSAQEPHSWRNPSEDDSAHALWVFSPSIL